MSEQDTDFRAYITADRRGQRLVITDTDSRDNAQASGRWISAAGDGSSIVELEP